MVAVRDTGFCSFIQMGFNTIESTWASQDLLIQKFGDRHPISDRIGSLFSGHTVHYDAALGSSLDTTVLRYLVTGTW